LFFQDRSIPSSASGSTITGNTGTTFDGSSVLSDHAGYLSGNSSVGGYGIVVADKLVVSGNSTLGNNYSSLANGSPIQGHGAI